jgi:predicted nucleotidyltransferase
MINEADKEKIITFAKKYNVSSVILFGSAAEGDESADIDLAVKGIDKRLFFRFYAELLKSLSKPVDLVDLSAKTLFNDIIEQDGIKIYG